MATITIAELVLGPDSYNEFNPADTYVISAFTAGTWNGTSGHPTVWRSSTAGSQVTIQIPENISVQYADFQDIAFTAFSVTADSTCSGQSSNNSGITWPSSANNGAAYFTMPIFVEQFFDSYGLI